MEALREAIYNALAADNPMTCRQCFYALTVTGMIEKTEPIYKGTVIRLLTQMRRNGVIPYAWISDNTRWMRKPQTYRGLGEMLRQTARFYRRNLWADADCYVEVWCEKDALAGVIMEETETYDVPLMVSKGFSSDTYLQSAAEAIQAEDKPAHIFQFGDHDPSGILIAQQVEKGLRRHAPNAEIHFERVAVTPSQIEQWSLPSRPTKRKGNNHAKGFEGDSVELDAIAAQQLRTLVRDCIERHVDLHQLDVLKVAEQSERQFLQRWADQVSGRGGPLP